MKIVVWNFFFCFCFYATVGESRQPGPAYALGQSSLFKKYERKNLEFFTWSWENDFGNRCSSLIEKIVLPLFERNRPHFQETKVNFLFNVFLY